MSKTNFPRFVFALSLALALSACGTRGPNVVIPEPEPTFTIANTIVVPPIEYGTTEAGVRLSKADDKCDIPALLATALQDNIVSPFEHVMPTNSRNIPGVSTLTVTITDILANAGGQLSGPKLVDIKATLSRNGTVIASFKSHRSWFPLYGFRSTCSIVGSVSDVLGGDMAKWLVNPVDGAVLGDK
jgi:hypothetical protein